MVVADIRDEEAAATVDLVVAAGGRARALHVDVTSTASVRAAFDALTDAPAEILVNCAGWDELKPFLDTDEAFWDRIIELNFKGVLRTTHAALPAMLASGWGRIVNIGSDAGRVGSSLEAVYSGAKGGVIAFTKTIARETARKGITANVVCPGPTATALLDEIVSASSDGDRVINAMAGAVPMKRVGQPAEVASAVAYLTSEDAGFVTGQTLSVSGGLTMA